MVFLLSLYFPVPPVPYAVTAELNTTPFMLWTPPVCSGFPSCTCQGIEWMNSFSKLFLWVTPNFTFCLEVDSWKEPGCNFSPSRSAHSCHSCPAQREGALGVSSWKFIWVLGRWIWSSKASCSWGGATPRTKPCWFPALWAHFGLRSLRDPSQPQPSWGIFDFEAIEFWFWSLIFYCTFLKAIKLSCTAALRGKISKSFKHFYIFY